MLARHVEIISTIEDQSGRTCWTKPRSISNTFRGFSSPHPLCGFTQSGRLTSRPHISLIAFVTNREVFDRTFIRVWLQYAFQNRTFSPREYHHWRMGSNLKDWLTKTSSNLARCYHRSIQTLSCSLRLCICPAKTLAKILNLSVMAKSKALQWEKKQSHLRASIGLPRMRLLFTSKHLLWKFLGWRWWLREILIGKVCRRRPPATSCSRAWAGRRAKAW